MSKFTSQKEVYDEIFEKQVISATFPIFSYSFKSNAIKIVYNVVIILETLS